jgi:hypothetical protein
MWSLTSLRAKRTSGARKFHPPTEKDFFNSICHERTSHPGNERRRQLMRPNKKPPEDG